MATVTLPRARTGAMRASQAPRPGARTPRETTVSMRSLDPGSRIQDPGFGFSLGLRLLSLSAIRSGVRMAVVGLHDLLHQLVPHDILVVEIDEADSLDVPHDAKRVHQP